MVVRGMDIKGASARLLLPKPNLTHTTPLEATPADPLTPMVSITRLPLSPLPVLSNYVYML